MSDTSETDAKVQFLIVSLKEVSRLSQTFKEQRDEARHDFEEQSEVVQNLKVALEEVSKLARTLKEERDEAREAAAKWESSSDAMERAGAEQARRADENREWALKAEREENKKFREALEWIAKRYDDSKPMFQVAMDAYEMSCTARAALRKEETK